MVGYHCFFEIWVVYESTWREIPARGFLTWINWWQSFIPVFVKYQSKRHIKNVAIVDGPSKFIFGAPPIAIGLIFHRLVEQRRCLYLLGLAMRLTFLFFICIWISLVVTKNIACEEIFYKIPSFGTEWLLTPCCDSTIMRHCFINFSVNGLFEFCDSADEDNSY